MTREMDDRLRAAFEAAADSVANETTPTAPVTEFDHLAKRRRRGWIAPLAAAAAVIVLASTTATVMAKVHTDSAASASATTSSASATITATTSSAPSPTAPPAKSAAPTPAITPSRTAPTSAAAPWYNGYAFASLPGLCAAAFADKPPVITKQLLIPPSGGPTATVVLSGECDGGLEYWVAFVQKVKNVVTLQWEDTQVGSAVSSLQVTANSATYSYAAAAPDDTYPSGPLALYQQRVDIAPSNAISQESRTDITPQCASGSISAGQLQLDGSAAPGPYAQNLWFTGPSSPCYLDAKAGMSLTVKDSSGNVLQTLSPPTTTLGARFYVTNPQTSNTFSVATELGTAAFPSPWCPNQTQTPATIASMDFTATWIGTEHFTVPPVYSCYIAALVFREGKG